LLDVAHDGTGQQVVVEIGDGVAAIKSCDPISRAVGKERFRGLHPSGENARIGFDATQQKVDVRPDGRRFLAPAQDLGGKGVELALADVT
jgi:hypothetical protein